LEEIIFEIFNIFENNIINVNLAKVLRYYKRGLTFFANKKQNASYVCHQTKGMHNLLPLGFHGLWVVGKTINKKQ
jgi:hypothetical protein